MAKRDPRITPEMVKSASETTRKYRLEHGLSVRQFADMVGVTRQAVRYWEVGEKIPSRKLLSKFWSQYNDWRLYWAWEILLILYKH